MTELLDSRVAGACCSPPGQVLATGEPLSLPSPPLPASFWGRLRHHPQPVRFAAGRALWWLALGPLAAVPHPLSGARPVRRKYVDVFIGWRDHLSERIAGLAESLWERRS